MNQKIGPFNARIPPGLTLDGNVSAAAFVMSESIPRRRIILDGPEIMGWMDEVQREFVVSLDIMFGVYAPHFSDGGGI